LVAELAQMLRNGALGGAQEMFQFPDRFFSVPDMAYGQQAGGMGQGFKTLGSGMGALDKLVQPSVLHLYNIMIFEYRFKRGNVGNMGHHTWHLFIIRY